MRRPSAPLVQHGPSEIITLRNLDLPPSSEDPAQLIRKDAVGRRGSEHVDILAPEDCSLGQRSGGAKPPTLDDHRVRFVLRDALFGAPEGVLQPPRPIDHLPPTAG